MRVGDTKVEDPADLSDAIATLEPGEKVEVELYRGDAKRTIEVRLGERPLQLADRLGR